MVGEHRRLCTIEFVAEGHAERCPGESCAFWDGGCVLEAAEEEIVGRPEVAAVLLELRRAIAAGAEVGVADVRDRLAEALGAAGDETGPGSGATELV